MKGFVFPYLRKFELPCGSSCTLLEILHFLEDIYPNSLQHLVKQTAKVLSFEVKDWACSKYF